MALLDVIPSNAVGVRYAEEESYGKLPGSGVVWYPFEPNTIAEFGGSISTIARNPLNQSRQRQKGVVVDMTASGGLNTDFTYTNLQDILQGFFFADLRKKAETSSTLTVSTVTASTKIYTLSAAASSFKVGNLVLASGFTNAANNGLKRITTVSGNDVTVAESLTDETPPAAAKLVVVGFQTAAGDLDVSVTGGDLPHLTSTTLDFTTLGLIPGEWIFIGGDTSIMNFSTAANSGFARVRSVATHLIVLDKTVTTFVTEANAAQTVQLFFGRVLKNEADPSLIKRRTYHVERTLGAPDSSSPSSVQGEYLIGAVADQLTLDFKTADKLTVDLAFQAKDASQVTAGALLSGDRPAVVSSDAFNNSSDFNHIRLTVLDDTNSCPTRLFAQVSEFKLTINNSVSPCKAIGVLGNFEVTAGQFLVDGSATAYFQTIEATQAVRDNSDVSFDFAIVNNNGVAHKQGVVVDVPLIALGDGRPKVEQDKPITVPLTFPAAADRNFNHTLLMDFYDYLPDVANPNN